jgi:hypothetical protein
LGRAQKQAGSNYEEEEEEEEEAEVTKEFLHLHHETDQLDTEIIIPDMANLGRQDLL